ncbi:MAG: tetratricopeptide repeat protein [Bacteroidales bacterium]|nr:tetratricopeptide repeat protein [Bacteroidales bacterium]
MENENLPKTTEAEDFGVKIGAFVEKNKKAIIIVIVAILVVILAFFGVKRFVMQPREEKANEAVFAAEQYFANSQFDLALNGNDKHAGFLEVADRYGRTKAGRRARYCAGLCYLQMGQYENAAKELKRYKGKDTFTPILALIAEGDAECDLGNNGKALGCYEKAAKMDDNFITTPYALFKAGMIHLMDGNGDKAKKAFQQIKSQYPESTEYREIDKYITWAENI